MRLSPKVVTMNAVHGGTEHPGRGLRGGKGVVRTGTALHEHHAEAVGKLRAIGRIGARIRGAVVAIVTGRVQIAGKAGRAKVRLQRILLAARGRIGTESHPGDSSTWCHLVLQQTYARKIGSPIQCTLSAACPFGQAFYTSSTAALTSETWPADLWVNRGM